MARVRLETWLVKMPPALSIALLMSAIQCSYWMGSAWGGTGGGLPSKASQPLSVPRTNIALWLSVLMVLV